MARYPFTLPGYENVSFLYEPAGFATKIYCDGKPMKKKSGKFTAALASGEEIALGVKGGFNTYIILFKGQEIPLTNARPYYEEVLTYVPLFMFLANPVAGGIGGAIGAFINYRIFRSKLPGPVKILLSLFMIVVSFFIFAFVSGAILVLSHKK